MFEFSPQFIHFNVDCCDAEYFFNNDQYVSFVNVACVLRESENFPACSLPVPYLCHIAFCCVFLFCALFVPYCFLLRVPCMCLICAILLIAACSFSVPYLCHIAFCCVFLFCALFVPYCLLLRVSFLCLICAILLTVRIFLWSNFDPVKVICYQILSNFGVVMTNRSQGKNVQVQITRPVVNVKISMFSCIQDMLSQHSSSWGVVFIQTVLWKFFLFYIAICIVCNADLPLLFSSLVRLRNSVL
jgi:hypothetical protein